MSSLRDLLLNTTKAVYVFMSSMPSFVNAGSSSMTCPTCSVTLVSFARRALDSSTSCTSNQLQLACLLISRRTTCACVEALSVLARQRLGIHIRQWDSGQQRFCRFETLKRAVCSCLLESVQDMFWLMGATAVEAERQPSSGMRRVATIGDAAVAR